MIYAVESWTFPTDGDEEPIEQEMVDSQEFENKQAAKTYAWLEMHKGYFVRLWIREAKGETND